MRRLFPLCVSLLVACGRPPSEAEIEQARLQVDNAVRGVHQARTALELLGLVPVYTCGEPRRTFVGRMAQGVQASVGCVTATAQAVDATTDGLVLSFAPSGCMARGHTMSGQCTFLYRGGEDALELEVDLSALRVDGESLQARVGYGTCGDERRYWVKASGAVPRATGYTFQVDGRVAVREGAPLLGATEVVLDGPGELASPQGRDRLTLTALLYELGEYLPKQGRLLVEAANGRRVQLLNSYPAVASARRLPPESRAR